MYSSDLTEFAEYFEGKGMMPESWQELDFEAFRKLMNNNFNAVLRDQGDQSAPPTGVWDGKNLVPEGMLGNVSAIFNELQSRRKGVVELTKRQKTSSLEYSSQDQVPDYPLLP